MKAAVVHRFDQTLAVTYQKASGFTRFLCEALDLSF